MLVRVERHPLGVRLWVGRWRIHHFHSGAALIVLGSRWVWRDREDLMHVFNPEVGRTTSDDKGVW